jgi:predicted signal transduction protein with EAL and GGDEF domain/DNA-binding response OmpR family regulator
MPALMPDIEPVACPSVLLIDDEPIGLCLTAAALRARGFVVTEVTDAAQALNLLQHWVPDLIVLDAVMPEVDGFVLCAEIRRLRGFELTPVMMLTGLEDDASIERAYAAGASDFYVKSRNWSLIAGRLRHLLQMAEVSRALLRSRAKLARAQDLARMGSFEWRLDRRRLTLEPEALRVLGRAARRDFGLRKALRMAPPAERAGLLALLREVVRHSTVLDTDVAIQLADGRRRVIHLEAEPEFDEQGRLCAYTGILQDVTDRRLIEDRIKHLANFDSLTGLPNRRQLLWRAERALEHARRMGHAFALLLIDLDRFKIINDTLGHVAGDELLVEVGRRLRQSLRHGDLLADASLDALLLRSHRALETIGRLGGDEFIALLPEITGSSQAEQVAQRMLQVLRQPFFIDGAECVVTASIGVAIFPDHGKEVVDLLRSADVAMYAAKGCGRNHTRTYQPQMSSQGRQRLALETALHRAVERHELVLHYQPKVDVRTREVVGVEALMRWRHNGHLKQPAEFIPLAEETGLILPLSAWALDEAARQIRQWRDSTGLDLKVAVNLPSSCFERGDVLSQIQAAADTHGVPVGAICLEITETSLMRSLETVMPVLRRLRQSGVSLSIDDFGTGYSSLSYLSQLPIGELKIDRSFVSVLDTPGDTAAVVTAIVALAKALKLSLVAEGVESKAQCDLLAALGCSTMQGFLFAHPMPAAEMDAWVHRYQRRDDTSRAADAA